MIALSIERVAHDRMAEMLQVDADLMVRPVRGMQAMRLWFRWWRESRSR